MVNHQAARALSANRLLARLPRQEYERLLPLLRRVPLEFKTTLNEPFSAIDHVYFPCVGVVSAVTLMQDGSSIEVATVGNEGLVGLPLLLGAAISPQRMIVQVGGEAERMEANAFQAETRGDGPFRRLMARYNTAFQYQMSQAVACNGLHQVQQRCCRWIMMTRDRVQSDEFPLTQEFLSHMLGVRRVSVTEVLRPLQEAGLIRNHRGKITVLDRSGLEDRACECYRNIRDGFDRLLGESGRTVS